MGVLLQPQCRQLCQTVQLNAGKSQEVDARDGHDPLHVGDGLIVVAVLELAVDHHGSAEEVLEEEPLQPQSEPDIHLLAADEEIKVN